MMQGSLAERLRVLRARRGLSLVEAAEKTGVGRDTLSDLERGRRRPVMPTLAKIARGYGVPVEDLLEPAEEGATPRPPVPQLTREQFVDHGVEPTSAEIASLNEMLKAYVELKDTGAEKTTFTVPEGPVDMERVNMLIAYAAMSGILTPEQIEVLLYGTRAALAAKS